MTCGRKGIHINEGSVIPATTKQGVVQLICTVALGYRKHTKTNFDWTVYLITS